MALNPYFNRFGGNPERKLQSDLFIEFVKQHGMDILYLPKVYLAEDTILNEVINHYHSRGMVIEMLLENYEDWNDNTMEFSTFGLMSIANEAIFAVSKDRFEEVVNETKLTFGSRPNEGDIIWSELLKEFFVIKKVKVDDVTRTADKWILKCEKYDDSNGIEIDMIDTHPEIPFNDSIEDFMNRDFEACIVDTDGSLEEIAERQKEIIVDKTINKENPNAHLQNVALDIIEN